MDKKGVVRTVSGNTCTVYLYDEKRDVSVSINNVDPGEPVKLDKVSHLFCLMGDLELFKSQFGGFCFLKYKLHTYCAAVLDSELQGTSFAEWKLRLT